MENENEKITIHQEERKTPVTIVQKIVKNRVFQYVVDSDCPLEECIACLEDFLAHVKEIKVRIEKEAEEKQKAESKPPEG